MPKGGARPGAGRPIEAGEVRKNRTLKATEAEWKIISDFAKILKCIDKKAAVEFVEKFI